ncbi:MAG: hypothetical protein Q7T11_00675, partial [Deltaproteobacteria bacterium]|nr:hypothetical protein [Deltaproteobacteria bacterium]
EVKAMGQTVEALQLDGPLLEVRVAQGMVRGTDGVYRQLRWDILLPNECNDVEPLILRYAPEIVNEPQFLQAQAEGRPIILYYHSSNLNWMELGRFRAHVQGEMREVLGQPTEEVVAKPESPAQRIVKLRLQALEQRSEAARREDRREVREIRGEVVNIRRAVERREVERERERGREVLRGKK